MKESFIFYRSFYEAINDLPEKEQLKIYKAICELSLNFKDTELKGLANTIFKLIKPQIEANNKRYLDGNKGGRPKKTTGYLEKETIGFKEKKPNNNENVNENVNENENDNENDNVCCSSSIYNYIEENFMITISGKNYEDIQSWLLSYPPNILKYAVDICVASGKRTIRYWEGILNNWKGCNYKTLDEIKENDKQCKKKDKIEPSWLNQEIKKESLLTDDEIEYLKSIE